MTSSDLTNRPAVLLTALSLACGSPPGEQTAQSADRGGSPGMRESAATVADRLPPVIGIAVSDTAGAWCAMFPPDSTSPVAAGRPLWIVFGDSTAPLSAVVTRPSTPCHAEFAQNRWFDYSGYDLALRTEVDTTQRLPIVGMAIASDARWSLGPDGIAVADLNRDGLPEHVRRCSADEGQHFTLWSTTPGGRQTRIGHEYYDWGAFVERTCGPGEDGIDSTAAP